MMTSQERVKTTFAEYAALPESSTIIELIDGEIIMTSVLDSHAELFTRLFFLLSMLKGAGILRAAPSGLFIDEHNSFEPDIFWISPNNRRCSLGPDGRYWVGGPDLVVEILSPSTAFRDRGVKFTGYQAIGVREYWLVDPEAQFIEVFVLREGSFQRMGAFGPGDTFASETLAVALEVAPLFV